MIFDVKKVTYNMYSYDISCMSREIMEMDGLDRATCRKSKRGTCKAFWDFLMNKTKQQIVVSPTLRDQKRKRRERGMQWGAGNGVFDFLEREGPPSL